VVAPVPISTDPAAKRRLSRGLCIAAIAVLTWAVIELREVLAQPSRAFDDFAFPGVLFILALMLALGARAARRPGTKLSPAPERTFH
jgi:hypothetical protein